MPKITLLPIWLKSDSLFRLTEELALALPSDLVRFPSQCAERLDELGYNALLLGLRDQEPERMQELSCQDFVNACDKLSRSHALLIKPHLLAAGCPADPAWCGRVRRSLDILCRQVPFQALFWESGLLHPSFDAHFAAADATQADLVLKEMRCVEEALEGRTRLIFYVPTNDEQAKRQAGWLSHLCDEADVKTSIAFSSFQGCPWHDHLPLHPFWEVLADSPDISATSLLPIVNMGMVGQGEGLWPNVPFDLFERCLSRCVRHRFDGPITLANRIPGKGGALECSLWMGARWSVEPAELLAEKWLKSRRDDLDFEAWRNLMGKTREISLEISALNALSTQKRRASHEHYRLQIESLLSRLKFVQCLYETKEDQNPNLLPTLSDYFLAFASDARILLSDSAKSLNVSIFGQSMADHRNAQVESSAKRKILRENSFQ